MSFDNSSRSGSKRPPARTGQKAAFGKPFGGKSSSGKSFDHKPSGSKPYGDRSFDHKPSGSKPYGDRSFDRKPADSKPYGDRSFDRKPADSKPYGDRSFDRKPADSKPSGDRSFDHKPSGSKPYGDRSFDHKPSGSKPYGDRSFDRKPAGKTYGDRSFDRKPAGKPYGDASHPARKPAHNVGADDRFYTKPQHAEPAVSAPDVPKTDLLLENEEAPIFIAGRNPVMEALKGGENLDTVFIENGQTGGSMAKIIALAKEAGCPVKEVSPQKLEGMSGNTPHQGVVLSISAVPYAELSDILDRAAAKGEKPFLIIAAEVEDPHNLGALIRTAETAGAHGIVIPKRRGVGLTATVFKSSAGAAAHIPVARVANLAATVDELKEKGVWIYGCDMEGQNWCETNFDGGVALLIGSEGRGLNRLLKEKCDVMVSLPMCGEITSLNASVAGGIIMYEVARQRLGLKSFLPKE